MAGIMDTLLKGFGSTDALKDYAHASRIFVNGNFLRTPKYAFMFYVIFDYADGTKGLGTPISRGTQIGALCKSATLPKYTVDHQVLNSYNRPNIAQKKLKYDPVTLKFHDDSDDIIREFWYDYMTYYYRDSDYTMASYGQDHKYTDRKQDQWGYGLRSEGTGATNAKGDYHPLKAIRIYSFYAKKFSEYVLINPVITSFRHGEHSNDGSNLLEHEMTVTYEAVKYAKGYVSDATFGDSMLLLYDRTTSSLTSGVTKSIFGPGGLIATANSTINDLADGNYLSAFLKINRADQTFKGTNLSQMLKDEGLDIINRAVRTGVNPLSTVNAPYISGVSTPTAALGLGLLAAGGLSSLSTTSRQSPAAGPQITVAQPTSALRDETYPSSDYRAVSGNKVVATPYQVPQTQASFPKLASTTTTSILVNNQVVRKTVVSEYVNPSQAASINLNLNQSKTTVSGATQGRQQSVQLTPPQLTTNDALAPDVIGYTYIFASDELNDVENPPVGQPVDTVRQRTLQKQLERVFSSQATNSLLAQTPELFTARDAFIADMKKPGDGAKFFNNNQQTFEVKKAELLAVFSSHFVTASVVKKMEQLQDILTRATGSQGNDEQSKLIGRQFREWVMDNKIRAAFADTVDILLYLYDIREGTFNKNNVEKYKINGQ